MKNTGKNLLIVAMVMLLASAPTPAVSAETGTIAEVDATLVDSNLAFQPAPKLTMPSDLTGDNPEDEEVRVLSSTTEGITFEVTVPWEELILETVSLEGRDYIRVKLDDWPLTSEPGAPILPALTEQIGIPFDAELTLSIWPGAVRTYNLDHPVLPKETQVVNFALPADEFSLELPEPVFVVEENPDIYNSPNPFPTDLVQITSDGYLRQQRIIGLTIQPLHYLPEAGQLSLYETLVVELAFGSALKPAVKDKSSESGAYEEVLQGELLNYEEAEELRQPDEEPLSMVKTMSEGIGLPYTPPDPGWRVKVREDGMYRLTYDELFNADVLESNPDPRTFQMFNFGNEVALQVIGEEDGTFDNGDVILFFGQAYATKYTFDNVYWLTYDPTGLVQGMRMQTLDASPGMAEVPLQYTARIHEENNYHYRPAAPRTETEEAWFWQTLIWSANPSMISWTDGFILPSVGTGEATITVALFGYQAVNSHHLKLLVNDVEVADVTWDGITWHTIQAVIPDGILHAGNNVTKLQWVNDTGTNTEVVYIDWYELEYPALIQPLNDSLSFNNTQVGTWDYVVPGFSTDLLKIYDLSNPLAPIELTGDIVQPDPLVLSYDVLFQDVNDSTSAYWIGPDSLYKTVHAIEEDTPSNLRDTANGADYLVISHANFMTQALQLADYRAGNILGQTPPQVLRTMAVDVQDIYDEFGYGIIGVEPIRAFLEYTYGSWEGLPAPSYVVLMGDGHRDPKGYQPTGRINFIPAYLAPIDPWIGETAADNLYVTLSGEDNLPDMMLGRLPVNTPADAQVMVDKIINYEQNPPPGPWQQQILTVADNADSAGDFAFFSESLHSCCLPAPYTPEKIYYGVNYTSAAAAQTAVINSLNSGKLLVNYNGHGDLIGWAEEQLFTTSTLASLTNANMLPVIVSMACRDGYYINNAPLSNPGEALAEMTVRAEGKGALASWSATGLGLASGHDHLNRGFYNAMFRDSAVTLGNATTAGKLNLYATGANLDLLDTYLLFGDPAQVIPISQPLSITGRVLDDTGNPIADVAVYDDTGHFALSDTDGYYTITGTPVGDFTLTPYKPGYAFTPETHNGTLTDTDITGKDFTGTLVPVFTISGYARDSYNNPIVGVLITDDKGHSTYTNDQGYYEITELFLGSHTLSAAKDHHLITPLQQTVEIVDSDLTLVNFVTDPLYALSGTITDGSGSPIPNVTVSNGQGLTTQTDASGTFSFPDLVAGSYNIIPSRIGYVFNPASIGVEIRTYDVTGVDFTAALDPIFSISGTITDGAVPVAGVTVSDGAGHSALTDDSGAYSITDLTLGSYTLTPEKADYIFDPVTQSPAIVDSDLTGIDFTAIPVYTISGTVRDAFDVPVPGVTVTDNLQGATDVTDAAGTYTLTTLPANTYTLTADKSGDTFFPASPGLNIVTVGSSATGIDFIKNNRVPGVTSTSPAYAGVDDIPFTLIINGHDFVQGAVVRWNGTDRTTTTIDSKHLSIDLTEADMETAGVNMLTVFNPVPGGGESISTVSFPIITHTPVVGEFILTNRVIFDWDDFSGATLYNIQMSLSSTFSGVVFNVNSPASSYTYGGTLLNARTYYWRIRPQINGSWGEWSQTWVFFSLIQNQPAINSITSDTTPYFSWFGYPGAIGYLLEVIPENYPDNPATSVLSISLPAVTNYTVPNISALDHGRYLWRLQVFTTSSALTTPWRPLSILPPAPALLSPANNSYATTRTPKFSWEPVPGVTGYQLIVDNNSDFRTPEYPEVTLPDTDSAHTLLSSLPADTRYYWRMRSTNLVGDGPWSPTYSFIVDTVFPAVPHLNAPADNAFTPDTTPSLSVFAAAGANRYNFQLASSDDFLSPLFDQTLASTTFTVPNADALPYSWRYYWRARSLDAAGNASDWSETRTFALTFQSMPVFDAVTSDTTPTFTWYGVPGAYGYLLEIIPEDNPATPSLSIPLPVVTNFTLPNISALKHERYLWRLHVFTASSAQQTPYRRLSITPPPPALISPANNTFVTTRTPELSWEPVTGVTGYKLIVDNNIDFRTPEYSEIYLPGTDSTHTLLSSLPADTRYYWRMSSTDAQENPGPWSATRSFVVDTVAPPNPVLYLPADNASVSGTPTYSWRASAGANAYEFQYSFVPDFGTIEYSSGVLTTLNHRPPTQDTMSYYWRVLARDAAGNWSTGSTHRIITVNLPVPIAPVLAAPVNNLLINLPPVLTWNAVPYGSTYEVQLSTNIYFTPASLLPLSDPDPSDLSLTLDPLAEGRYYWRARAVNANLTGGPWSGYRSFVIDTTAPPNPALYLPANTASVSGTPTFSWRGSAGANAYEFQYAAASDFSTIDYSSGVLASLSHRPPTMNPGTYYWRVLARDAAGNWSTGPTPRTITINLPVPAAPALAAPANNLFTNPTPVLSWSPVPYGNTYEVQLSTNIYFTPASLLPFSDPVLSDLFWTLGPLDEGRYYWRVRAINANLVTGPWSGYRSFVIDTTAQALPRLNAPADNAFTPDTAPSLSVFGVSGANRYNFQLSDSSDFSAPLFDQTLISTTFTVPNANALPYADDNFWRARSLDAAGNASDWSEPRSFTITFQNAPAYNAATSDTTPTFTWYGVSGALGYKLEVIPDSTPGNPTIDSFSVSLPAVTGYTIPNISALDHGAYLWRITAFTISGTRESPWRPLHISAPAPALLNPANNTFVNTSSPTLSWTPVTGAARYELWIDDSSYFNSLDYQIDTINGSDSIHTLLSNLPFNRRYFWRMRSIDFLGTAGPWSPTYSFIVDTVFPAVPRLNAPADNSFTADTTPSLSVFGVSGANRYNFQLSTSSDFSSPLFDQTVFSTTFTVPNADALPYAEGYFWRARSLDAAGNASDWSEPRTFTIMFQNAPAYNAATTDTTPNFTWYGVPGALGYRLEVIPAPKSGNPTTDSFAVSLPTITGYTIPNISTFDYGWYQWRVRVYTLSGSQYTPWRPFTVTPPPLAAPVLSSPVNVVINTSNPEFSWLSVNDAAGYEIMVDNSVYFNSPEYNATGITGLDTVHTGTGTLYSGVFYWRMRTVNYLAVAGPWSTYRAFRIIL